MPADATGYLKPVRAILNDTEAIISVMKKQKQYFSILPS
jgi:hypothetical protein